MNADNVTWMINEIVVVIEQAEHGLLWNDKIGNMPDTMKNHYLQILEDLAFDADTVNEIVVTIK